MSRSGKFIPGASRRRGKSEGNGEGGDENKSEPIRASTPAEETPGGGRRMFGRGGSRHARGAKGGRKPGQLLLFAGVAFLLIIGIGYYFVILPQQQEAERRNQQLMAELKKMQEDQEKERQAFKKMQEEIAAAKASKKGTLIVDTRPSGAQIKFAGEVRTAPLRLADVAPGEYVLLVSLEGYEPQEMAIKFEGEEVKDQGTIELIRQRGSLTLSSSKKNVSYVLKAPEDFRGQTEGYLPMELKDVPTGLYDFTLTHQGWELPYKLEVAAGQTVEKDVRFGYGHLVIESDPAGATVSDGVHKLGVTPLELKDQRPGERRFGLDKFGYKFERISMEVIAHEETKKSVKLAKGRDIRTSFGLELVWVPEMNLYVSETEVSQKQYLAVMGTNPSAMRGSDRPVDNVTWENAEEFCKKATARERGKGTIPGGYRFRLPSESQWTQLLADSAIETSFTSHSVSRDGSAPVGASAPNELGIYDMVGNVNEWTRTPWQGSETARTIRGGNWLSSESNFPDRSRAFGGSDRYRDKFTGFRVVLEK